MYENWKAAVAFAKPYADEASRYLGIHSQEVAFWCLALFFAGMLCVLAYKQVRAFWAQMPTIKKRGSRMTGQAREAELRVMFADDITDMLTSRLSRNKITEEEYLTWADRFGNLCDLRDLISNKQLTIKQRLTMSKRLRDARKKRGEDVKPVPIPEPVSVPKNAFDAIVKRKAS
jgi:hypothetical protein